MNRAENATDIGPEGDALPEDRSRSPHETQVAAQAEDGSDDTHFSLKRWNGIEPTGKQIGADGDSLDLESETASRSTGNNVEEPPTAKSPSLEGYVPDDTLSFQVLSLM